MVWWWWIAPALVGLVGLVLLFRGVGALFRGRFFGGIAALAVLWIFVYWWWEPRGGAISVDPGPPAGDPRSGEVVWVGAVTPRTGPASGAGAGNVAKPPHP